MQKMRDSRLCLKTLADGQSRRGILPRYAGISQREIPGKPREPRFYLVLRQNPVHLPFLAGSSGAVSC